MSDASNVARNLRDRLGANTEERLGRALSDLLENPLLTGAIGRAFDAREKAAQAQEVAMGALNLPSAADIERLTRRVRSVSLRLEGIEEGVDRLDRTRTPDSAEHSDIDRRLRAIETQLQRLTDTLDAAKPKSAKPKAAQPKAAKSKVAKAAKPKVAKAAKPRAGAARPGKA
jgi:hypothetical protein